MIGGELAAVGGKSGCNDTRNGCRLVIVGRITRHSNRTEHKIFCVLISTPPATGTNAPPTAWAAPAKKCGRSAAITPRAREPRLKDSAPWALPWAIWNRLKLAPSSLATAMTAPRASRTATLKGLKPDFRARIRACSTMVWATLSVITNGSVCIDDSNYTICEFVQFVVAVMRLFYAVRESWQKHFHFDQNVPAKLNFLNLLQRRCDL